MAAGRQKTVHMLPDPGPFVLDDRIAGVDIIKYMRLFAERRCGALLISSMLISYCQ